MTLPASLQLNAWTGTERAAEDPPGPHATDWALRSRLPKSPEFLLAEERPDPRDWKDARVGWGLVLVEDETIPAAARAVGADAPAPLRDLLGDRAGSPVLRYRPGSADRFGTLRKYLPDGSARDLDIVGSEFGLAADRIPQYLLIYGPPSQIPWDLQYALNARFAVGRIALDGPALENYLNALRSGWAGAGADPFRPVVWATEKSAKDITALMKRSVALKVYDRFRADADIAAKATLLESATGGATVDALARALAESKPGLVVTTSHGATDSSGGAAEMARGLGMPVGEDGQLVSAERLAAWDPYGAIWYAHACCSAGSSGDTVYEGLFENDSYVGKLLSAVAGLGSMVAPLPQALLGHARPLRAFVGHVEPTFDWTISQPQTGQALTSAIETALYDNLYQEKPFPVGLAFGPYFDPIGSLAAQQVSLRRAFDRGEQVGDQVLSAQLAARDRMSTVILGDPTVAFTFAGGPAP